jgi:hypothetical protein
LVYLNNNAFDGPSLDPAPLTFSTTAYTKTQNTLTVNPAVLATSNGHSGSTLQLGSTSKGSLKIPNGSSIRAVVPSLMVALSVMMGGLVVGRVLTR